MTKASNPIVALNWIDGAWVGGEQVRESINPATYEVIGAYADGGLEAARAGIAAAKRAFQTSAWAVDHELRARVIGQIADAFEGHRDSLLDLLASENGKVNQTGGLIPTATGNNGECSMSKSAVEVLQAILDNPKDIGNVRSWTSPDVTYVSLNYSNPELKRVMPWCGTAQGPEVIVKTFVDVGRYWTVEAFEPKAVFGSGEHAAMFGSFTYRSVKLGKQVTSPFSVYARVVDGKCVYLQFMEDTLATTESFRKGGAWTIHSDPDGDEISI